MLSVIFIKDFVDMILYNNENLLDCSIQRSIYRMNGKYGQQQMFMVCKSNRKQFWSEDEIFDKTRV